MMKAFDQANVRVLRFSDYLNKLYYNGKLNLKELQAFRGILEEITRMFQKLRSLSHFGIVPWYVKKDLNKLNSELTLMEYNVSLISVGAAVAV